MTGLRGHGLLVEHREQAEHFAVGVEQWRPEVAFDPQPDERLRLREPVLHPGGVVTQPAVRDFFTRRAGQVVLEVLLNPSPRRKGKGACSHARAGELGDRCERHAEGRGQVGHQVLEELLARTASCRLHHGSEGFQVVGDVAVARDPLGWATRGLASKGPPEYGAGQGMIPGS